MNVLETTDLNPAELLLRKVTIYSVQYILLLSRVLRTRHTTRLITPNMHVASEVM